ncbi:MAG: hypothetical protein NTY65_06160 [Planctomycetota bacterium]|nr:hypothetical protein [Planctomycetota bacterium]
MKAYKAAGLRATGGKLDKVNAYKAAPGGLRAGGRKKAKKRRSTLFQGGRLPCPQGGENPKKNPAMGRIVLDSKPSVE